MILTQTSTVIHPPANDDWLGSEIGVDTGKPATLDLALFDIAGTFVKGYLPSGLVLAKHSSGKYGRYVGGANDETQRITVNATGGTYTITFQGEATAAIAATATAAQVQAALELLPGINAGDIAVTGGPGNTAPIDIRFLPDGQYGGQDAPAFTTGTGSLTGGAGTAAVTVPDAGGDVATGLDVPKGFLLKSVIIPAGVTTGNAYAALWKGPGHVRPAKLPSGSGIDAHAQEYLGQRGFIFND